MLNYHWRPNNPFIWVASRLPHSRGYSQTKNRQISE